MTARQAIIKTAQPSHYLVQFEIDECVSIVQRKHLLEPPIPSVGEACRVEWSGEEYTAKLLAMGSEVTVRKAEEEYLTSIDPFNEEENEPLKKKRRLLPKLTKQKKAGNKTAKAKAATGRKKVQKRQTKSVDFVLDLGSPVKPIPQSQSPSTQPASQSPPTQPAPQSLPVAPPSVQPLCNITNTRVSTNLNLRGLFFIQQ